MSQRRSRPVLDRKGLPARLVLAGLLSASIWGHARAVEKADREQTEPALITFAKIDRAWSHGTGEGTTVAILDWLFDLGPEAAGKYVHPVSMVPDQEIGFGEAWHGEWMAAALTETRGI